MRLYVAGPLFNTHERMYLEQIAARLETLGFSTFLPHRDAGLLSQGEDREAIRPKLFYSDVAALDKCDGCVALLTGADQDSGTCVELGYLFAKGKPCIGVTDDMRGLNNMVWGVCDEGRAIVRSLDEMTTLVQQTFGTQG